MNQIRLASCVLKNPDCLDVRNRFVSRQLSSQSPVAGNISFEFSYNGQNLGAELVRNRLMLHLIVRWIGSTATETSYRKFEVKCTMKC